MGKKRKMESYAKLGAVEYEEKKKLDYVPAWIKVSTPVSCDIQQEKKSLAQFDRYLSSWLIEKLEKKGITHLFPVQSQLIPELLDDQNRGLPPRDICVSAPTGSGKTLSYVLPILEVLSRSSTNKTTNSHAIRALIILPVVDLAKQVYEVFRSFIVDTADEPDRLKIALLTGQQELDSDIRQIYSNVDQSPRASVDIVVATPGRLLEHILESGGAFDLRYLRFLVIDEADRLLSDYRIEWFKAVEKAVFDDDGRSNRATRWFYGERKTTTTSDRAGSIPIKRYRPNVGNVQALFASGRYPLQKIFLSATLSYDPGQLQRLNLFRPKLFRARRDANVAPNVEAEENGESLRYANVTPKVEIKKENGEPSEESKHHDDSLAPIDQSIAMDEDQSVGQLKEGDNSKCNDQIDDYSASDQGIVVLPSELKEYYLGCAAVNKPLAVYCLLTQHESDWIRVLCFVQSRENSRRLATVLESMGMGSEVKELSAGLTRMRRFKVLKKFSLGKVRILICSDLLARGIDIAEVDCVINYDPPKQMLAYVHRAGRTARAGRPGTVITVAEEKEMTQFKSLMESGKRWSAVSPLEIAKERFKELRPKYREAMSKLKDVVETQKRNVRQRRFKKRPPKGTTTTKTAAQYVPKPNERKRKLQTN